MENLKTRQNITTELNILLNIAQDQTEIIFKKAVAIIDEQFGPAYAMKNPQLLCSLLDFQQKTYNSILDITLQKKHK